MKNKWIWIAGLALAIVAIVAALVLLRPENRTPPAGMDNAESFRARIIECFDHSVLVKPEDERMCDKISFSTRELEDIGAGIGDLVEITFPGVVMESYPAQIVPISWKMIEDVPDGTYTGDWLDKDTVEYIGDTNADLYITEITSGYMMARGVYPSGTYRINWVHNGELCVGDRVYCKLENVFRDADNQYEGTFVSYELVDDTLLTDKPVIYLYPRQQMEVEVGLDFDGVLTCTYPAYQDGWKVTAQPDGTLIDMDGKVYNYLYWEGVGTTGYDMSEGFCVAGNHTADFLEWALEQQGLNRREANEFIVYWLPLMQNNPYNIISFQTDAYTDSAKLDIQPRPDTMIRVFMAWQASDAPVTLEPQSFSAPERSGFTVVEWGGSEIK